MSGSVEESHLVVLRLTPIKEALRQSEWERSKEKILAALHRELGEALATDDAYTIHGDETCMIALAKTTIDQAKETAKEISEKIVGGLFGELGTTSFPLEPQVLAIRDMLREVNPEDPDGALFDILNDQYIELQGQAKLRSPDDIRKKAIRQARRRKLLELFEPEKPTQIMHEYRPLWNVDDQLVNCFRYVPYLRQSANDCRVSYRVLAPNYSLADLIELDVESIENAIIDLKQAVDEGRDVKLSLSVHFETVSCVRGRSELTGVLSVLPTSFRNRIVFTIEEIPEGIPEGRLQEVVGFLKSYSRSRSVVLETIPTDPNVLRSLLAKMRSVGMDMVIHRLPEDASSRDVKSAMALVPLATSMGLKVGIYRVPDNDTIFELIAAGCSILGGLLFGGPFENMPHPYTMSVRDLEQPSHRANFPRFLSG